MSNESTAARIDQPGLAPEEMPSLDAFYEEPSGNIAPGWYGSDVLEGYATGKGTQFVTSDQPSVKAPGKRELRFCLGLNVNGSQRNLQKTFFYTPEQFSPENLAHIKQLREQFKGQRSWAGQGQAQNFSINLTQLSQLERAVGFKLVRHPNGGFLVAPYVGKKLDVRVSTGKNGYDEVTGFAAAGSRAARK